MHLTEKIAKLADMLLMSKKTMVLTGAGISTESGIPDFRGPDGLWTKVDPIYVFSAETFLKRPHVFYEVGIQFLDGFQDVAPNAAHYVLARLEKAGLIKGIITQNVDGLHQKAGSQYVLELHGHLRSASCLACGGQISWAELTAMVRSGPIPPRCRCGGVYKPDAVFFGDPLPPDFHVACREASASDLMIVVGSSLEVSPANYIPHLSKRLVIVNMGETTADYKADLLINARAGEAFTLLEEELMRRGIKLTGEQEPA